MRSSRNCCIEFALWIHCEGKYIQKTIPRASLDIIVSPFFNRIHLEKYQKMKRRNFLEKSAFGFTGITSAALSTYFFSCGTDETARSKKEKDSRPNFLVIVSDDTGFADVGYHGSEIKTSNIDHLARVGVELDHFYVYPVCSPTRAAFLTGRPPSRFGILGPLQIWTPPPFEPGTITLAEMLRRAGYETCISGKWHLGMRPEEGPNHFGFDHSYGYTGPWLDSYSHLTTNFHGDKSSVRQWHRNGELIDETGHVTDLITDEAIRFIREIRDTSRPFFLYVPYSAPHTPIQEENKWTDMYSDSIENVSRRYYAAAMTHMDDCIGQIISVLEEEQLIDFASRRDWGVALTGTHIDGGGNRTDYVGYLASSRAADTASGVPFVYTPASGAATEPPGTGLRDSGM